MDEQKTTEDYSDCLLTRSVDYSLMDAGQPQSGHESSQMTEEVDSFCVSGGKDEDEDDYHKASAPHLAFQNWSYQVQPTPVDDDVADDQPDDAIKGCRRSSFDWSRVY